METKNKNDWRKTNHYARLEARISRKLMDSMDDVKGELSRTAFVKRALRFAMEARELLNDERVESLTNLKMPMHPDEDWSCIIVLKEGVDVEQFKNGDLKIIRKML